ncbi:NADAR family protein [Chryseobacterium sp. PTM-20240506]|uniref:NADAR family protein n=1 Tax=unclassified Chryseobacterium TaxID=2593645 RepID=UPI00235A2D89|nr:MULTISPECIES: NADAR family protein [unclassified Chryseobacterium]MDC8105985.1 NADAR family protein [Chryseobacterium sp. B21-037]MDQ1804488.1 NADAR family protein [Chryseobacterium sp. CKR4-1]
MKYNLQNIIQKFQNKEELEFLFFWGHTAKDQITKACFSQWYLAEFEEGGVIYKTAEHYMMAEKARLFNDENIEALIIEAQDPKEAKGLGRKIKNFDHHIWDEHKYEIVKRGNFFKFLQNGELKKFLLSTGDKLIIEASPYDKIWGIGMLESDPEAKNPLHWRGENLLGFALMEVRDDLKE